MSDTTLGIKIVLDGTGKAESELSAVNRQIADMATKAQNAGSATHALDSAIAKSAQAAQVARQAFEQEAAAKLRSKAAADTLAASSAKMGSTISSSIGRNLQNVSFQLQDFIVQTNGGVSATKALAQQLPQMLVGFGATGAAIGVVAALLPNLIQAFGASADNSKTLGDAMSDLDKAIGAVGSTVKTFDMEKLYEQFNKSNDVVRASTIEQLNFQKALIETERLTANKKFGESLSNVGMPGLFSGRKSATEVLAKDLGITLDLALKLQPELNKLRDGTGDVSAVFDQFGTKLLSGNDRAIELAKTMNSLAKAERDGAAAATAISEAQAKMGKGHVQTKKEADDAAKAHDTAAAAAKREAEALKALLDSINGKSAEFDTNYVKNVETLLRAYDKGAVSLAEFNTVFERYIAMQPGAVAAAKELAKAEKEADEARSKHLASVEDETQKLVEKAKEAEYELSLIGKSTDEIERLTAARYNERIELLQDKIAAIEMFEGRNAETEAVERQIEALGRLKAAEIARPKLTEQAREWEKFADDIERSLTDSLFRAFESGEDFGRAFAKSLEATFKAMVLKFAIQATISTGGNLVNAGINAVLGTGGDNGGAGTNYFGLADKANSIYNLYGAATGYSPVVNTLAGLLGAGSTVGASAGSLAYANTVGAIGGDALGAFIASNNSWAGVATGTAEAAAAAAKAAASAAEAAAAASAVEGGAAGAAGGAASGAGSFGWVPYVGWAVAAAAAIYAFKDKIFGGDWEPSGAPRFSGTFSQTNSGMASAYTLQDWQKDGGWFGSDKAETRASAISNEFDALLDRIYAGVRDNYLAVGKLFDDADLAAKLVGFGMRVDNLDFSDAQAAVEKMSKDLAESMGRTLFPSVSALQKAGEAFADTFTRVVSEAQAVDAAFKHLGTTLGEQFGKNNADRILSLSDGLVAAFGGIETMLSAVEKYYAGYYSPADQREILQASLEQQFAALNLAMPETRTEFRRLVESLDLTSSAGQTTYAALINMAEGFGTWADSLAGGTDEMANAIEQALAGLFDGLLEEIQSARAGLIEARASISGIEQMSAAQIRAAIAGAVPGVPGADRVLETQQALQRTITNSDNAISSAVTLRDAEQAAVNQRNQGWAYRVADLPAVGGWALTGGEQVNEFNTIVAAAQSAGVLAGANLAYSNYRDSLANFSLANGYQFFLDGTPIGQNLSLQHGQDWIAANGQSWGRYNRDLDVYAYKPYGSETINPWYDQNVAAARSQGAAAISAAEAAATQAQIDYTRAIRDYVVDASKAVDKLNDLRDQTVSYYQAQQALADAMVQSATNLRDAVKLARQSQMTPEELIAQRQREFATAYSLALATTGTVQAGYADKMTALLPVLVASLEDTAASQVDWARATGTLYAQSNTIAGQLETQAAVDFQTESLALLGAIDAALSSIEAGAASAEKIISDAVYATGATTADGLRAVIAAIRGQPIPAFAGGGDFAGGWRLVGERGPELEATGPARIFNAEQTRRLLGGGPADDRQARLIEALIAEVTALRAEVRAVAGHTYESAKNLKTMQGDGVIVRTETGAPLETVTA